MTSGIVTIALLALFVGGWIWAWRPARRAEFEAAAAMPLDDDAYVSSFPPFDGLRTGRPAAARESSAVEGTEIQP